jgi:tetratricopeptide (TPR) repeat protein
MLKLKKMKKISLVFCLFLSLNSFSQDSKLMKDAFTNSFNFESKLMFPEAIKSMNDIYNEKSYFINARLGWLHYLKKEYETSISYYNKAIALSPKATEPLWGIVLPQLALEQWVALENTYLTIVKFDPKNSLVNYRLGVNYYYKKNYVEALKYFDVSLTLYPTDYDAMNMTAWTNYFLGKKEEAKILFTRILLMYQTDASALEGLALCNK